MKYKDGKIYEIVEKYLEQVSKMEIEGLNPNGYDLTQKIREFIVTEKSGLERQILYINSQIERNQILYINSQIERKKRLVGVFKKKDRDDQSENYIDKLLKNKIKELTDSLPTLKKSIDEFIEVEKILDDYV